MSDVVSGTRCGPFIILMDESGRRHAVRHAAILAISDLDETFTSSTLHLSGNRSATVRSSLDQVLGWFA